MMIREEVRMAALAVALGGLGAGGARAGLTFYVDPGSPWPSGWYNAAVADMQTTVNEYNAYGDFTAHNSGSIYVYYNSGIPTAQSGYGGWGGSIGDGGTYPNVRVLLHESSHWLGTGTYSANWSGPAASAMLQQFDGVGAVLNGDSAHYWPYGENYDSESSPVNDLRHVAMVYALRQDYGIGNMGMPSAYAATAVSLSASDAVGTSGFNYTSTWSDNTFAHSNADYSTGNFILRTPASAASYNFAGKSLTVNNTNGSGGGLLYSGSGTGGVTTFRNLILNGGYVRQGSTSADLFQLAGAVTLSGTPVFDAAQGPIQLSTAALGGSGSLTKTGPYALTVATPATYSGNTTINSGVLRLSTLNPVADYTFDSVAGSTVNNTGSGGAAMNGTLSGGAAIVAGGRYGSAVSLSGGASVDINNAIVNLGPTNYWTVSAWVKTATPGATILSKSGGGWGNGNSIFYLGDGTGAGAGSIPSSVRWGGGFFQGSTSAASVTDNAWHMVTYSNAGGAWAIYVDGNSQPLSSGNASLGVPDFSSLVRLGFTTDTVAGDGTVNFNGLMDDVRFYNQALSPSQVSSLYRSNSVSGALPATTNVSIAAGATLDLNGAVQQVASLSGPSGAAVKLGSGTLNVAAAGSTTFAGSIAGAGGSLVKSGTGTLTLAGPNTYTGSTNITAGTLRLSAPATGAAATPLASYSFSHLAGNTVINDGSGGGAMNGTLNLNGGSGFINPSGGPTAGMGALVLNGSGSTVDINSGVTDLSSGSSWTVSAWIKTTQSGATILNKGDGANWNSGYSTFYLGTGNNSGSGGLPDAVRWGGGWLAGATPVNDGSWHLITYTDSAGVKNVYVDGLLESLTQNQFFNTDTGSKIRIGFAPTNVDGEVPTSGTLSGINIYNSALSSAQVAALYNAVAGNAGALPTSTDVTVAAGATLDINGITQQIGSLSGPAGASVTLGAGQLIVASAGNSEFAGSISGSGGSVVKAGAGAFTLSGSNSYSGATTVNGGTLVFGSSFTSSAPLTVGNGAAAQLTQGGGKVLKFGAVNLNNSGKLDLGDGKLILSGSDAGTLVGYLQRGYSGGSWNGAGLMSSAAAGDANHVSAIGWAAAADLGVTTWGGVAVNPGDLLTLYTEYGDLNLDGRITADDYALIDRGFAKHLSGWINGDVNYDGVVDAADYLLMDTAFGKQNGVLSPDLLAARQAEFGAAYVAALTAAVPEPASLGAAGLATVGLLGRRRRAGR